MGDVNREDLAERINDRWKFRFFGSPKETGIGVMDRGFEGLAADGRAWPDLHYCGKNRYNGNHWPGDGRCKQTGIGLISLQT